MRFAIHLNFAIEIGSKSRLTDQSWGRLRNLIKRRDNAVCYYCGQQDKNGHADHLIPLSKGGSDDPSNLVWACQDCNLSKSDLTVSEWEARNGEDADPIIDLPDKRELVRKERGIVLYPAFARGVLAEAVTFSERGAQEYQCSRVKFRRLRDYLEREGYIEYMHQDKRQGIGLTESGISLFENVAKGEISSVLA